MIKKFSALLKNNQGATAVEFALVAPFLFILTFGIIEFSLLFAERAILEGATAQAARRFKAETQETKQVVIKNDALKNYIASYGGGLIKKSNLSVYPKQISGFGGAGGVKQGEQAGDIGLNVGKVVQYNVYYVHNLMTPLISRMIAPKDGKITVEAYAIVQNEPAIK